MNKIRLNKQVFIVLWRFSETLATKYWSLNNQPCINGSSLLIWLEIMKIKDCITIHLCVV